MLRLLIVGIGAAFLVGAALLLLLHGPLVGVIYLGVGGLVLVAAILFARGRYQSGADRGHDRWQSTGERFVDPTSGSLMEVRYDPATGERDYVEVDQDHSESDQR